MSQRNNREARRAGIAKQTTIVVIAAVVLFTLVGLGEWLSRAMPSAPQATFAPDGELVSGFPKELILDPAAIIGDSYTINYTANLNQYTASWTSSSSIEDLYSAYVSYFISQDWTIVNSSTALSTFHGIYAVTSTAAANIAMDGVEPTGTKVTVSYVKK